MYTLLWKCEINVQVCKSSFFKPNSNINIFESEISWLMISRSTDCHPLKNIWCITIPATSFWRVKSDSAYSVGGGIMLRG